jgi:hypothetical protein
MTRGAAQGFRCRRSPDSVSDPTGLPKSSIQCLLRPVNALQGNLTSVAARYLRKSRAAMELSPIAGI